MSIGYLVDYNFWTTTNGIFTDKLQTVEFNAKKACTLKSEILKTNESDSY